MAPAGFDERGKPQIHFMSLRFSVVLPQLSFEQSKISVLMALEYRTGHLHCPVDLFLLFFAFPLFQYFQDQGDFIGGELDPLSVCAGD